ncbi:hypothetical protein PsYK624_161010 [Phanerochaete sordida]|uniref:Uncharacterized protein n=1 Tax=Phanerochaete sordida TaxID=48140 RepID=A0A9P3GQ65_9APHY|nr:hypothetical protein PsYK624_161010 [Phanerochaete sordida]
MRTTAFLTASFALLALLVLPATALPGDAGALEADKTTNAADAVAEQVRQRHTLSDAADALCRSTDTSTRSLPRPPRRLSKLASPRTPPTRRSSSHARTSGRTT